MQGNVMGDKTCVHELIPESKRDFMTLKYPHSPNTNKIIKIEPSAKEQWRLYSGIVKASCCVNFSHQKQQSAVRNTVELSKSRVKPLNESDRRD
jgi:hypothetical protein